MQNFWNTVRFKNIVRIVAIVALILLVPLVAMQFTNEVRWDALDFVIVGTALTAAGLFYEFIIKGFAKKRDRIIWGVLLFVAILLAWVELAVGIFD